MLNSHDHTVIALEKYLNEVRLSEQEHLDLIRFLNALKVNDSNIIAEYEACTNPDRPVSFWQLCFNRKLKKRASELGFTELTMNEYGWFEHVNFLHEERIFFEPSNQNYIRVGQSLNGRWANAIHVTAATEGMGSGLTVYCNHYSNKKECLIKALTEVIEWHQRRSEKDKLSRSALLAAQQEIDELTGKRPVQLSLF